MLLTRTLFTELYESIRNGRVLILYGPRRVGKTFLLKNILAKKLDKKGISHKYVHGESRIVQDQLSSQVPQTLKSFTEDKDIFIIDEAHKIPDIGLNLKLLVDTYKDIKIIASGSASFELAQKLSEPLTGRKKVLKLYPISAGELIKNFDHEHYLATYEDHMIYGGYPQVITAKTKKEKKEVLEELVDSYLFRDVLEMDRLKNAKKLRDLLTLLAFQIGSEVSLNEIGNRLDLHKDTVARYLDILEKSFVLINIRGFSRNLRKEISKNSRYYFYDNGVRNALIKNFNPPKLRNDMGMLWENYLIIERLKRNAYKNKNVNYYFWRTYDQKEIDLIEETGGNLTGYEVKWGSKKPKLPREFLDTYSNSKYKLVNRENFLEFLS